MAERHQIGAHMGPAAGERQNMMHLFRRRELAALQTLLAEWMLGNIAVSNPLPRPAISAAAGRIALISVISGRDLLLMGLAISALSQVGSAGIGAGALGFSRHGPHLLWTNKRHQPEWLMPLCIS